MSAVKAADVKRGIAVIWENLQCPICLDLISEPVSTRCDHQFCKFCVTKLLERNKRKETRCPVCKATITKRSLQESPGFQKLVEGLQGLVRAYEFDTFTNYFTGLPQRSHAASVERESRGQPGSGDNTASEGGLTEKEATLSSTAAAKDAFAKLMCLEDSCPASSEHDCVDGGLSDLLQLSERKPANPEETRSPQTRHDVTPDAGKCSGRTSKRLCKEPDRIVDRRQKKSVQKVSEWLLKISPTSETRSKGDALPVFPNSENCTESTASQVSTESSAYVTAKADQSALLEVPCRGLEEQVFGAVYKRERKGRKSFPLGKEIVSIIPSGTRLSENETEKIEMKRRSHCKLTPADFIKKTLIESQEEVGEQRSNDEPSRSSEEKEAMVQSGPDENTDKRDESLEFEVPLKKPRRSSKVWQDMDCELTKKDRQRRITRSSRGTTKDDTKCSKSLSLVCDVTDNADVTEKVIQSNAKLIQTTEVNIESYPSSAEPWSPVAWKTRRRLRLQEFTAEVQGLPRRRRPKRARPKPDDGTERNPSTDPDEPRRSDQLQAPPCEKLNQRVWRNGCVYDEECGNIEVMQSNEDPAAPKSVFERIPAEEHSLVSVVPDTVDQDQYLIPCSTKVSNSTNPLVSPVPESLPQKHLESPAPEVLRPAVEHGNTEQNEDTNDSELDTEQLMKTFKATKRKSFYLGSPRTSHPRTQEKSLSKITEENNQDCADQVPIPCVSPEGADQVLIPCVSPEGADQVLIPCVSPEGADQVPIPGVSPEGADQVPIPGVSPEGADQVPIPGVSPEGAPIPGVSPEGADQVPITGISPEGADQVPIPGVSPEGAGDSAPSGITHHNQIQLLNRCDLEGRENTSEISQRCTSDDTSVRVLQVQTFDLPKVTQKDNSVKASGAIDCHENVTTSQDSSTPVNIDLANSVLLFSTSVTQEERQISGGKDSAWSPKDSARSPRVLTKSSEMDGKHLQTDLNGASDNIPSGNVSNSEARCNNLESSVTPDGLVPNDPDALSVEPATTLKLNEMDEGGDLHSQPCLCRKRKPQRLESSDSESSVENDDLPPLAQILQVHQPSPAMKHNDLQEEGQSPKQSVEPASQDGRSRRSEPDTRSCPANRSVPPYHNLESVHDVNSNRVEDGGVPELPCKDEQITSSQVSVDLFGSPREGEDGVGGTTGLSMESSQYSSEIINTQQRVEMQQELHRLERMMALVSEALHKKDSDDETKTKEPDSGQRGRTRSQRSCTNTTRPSQKSEGRGQDVGLDDPPADVMVEKKLSGETLGECRLKDECRTGSGGCMQLVASGLSTVEQSLMRKFARKMKASVSSQVTSTTTHIIIKTDGDLVCERTLKYFQGIAGRKWVVSFLWISECFRHGKLLAEVPYEVCGDVVNGRDHHGPRKARTALDDDLLMKGCEICFQGSFTDMSSGQMEVMVEQCGAVVMKDPLMFSRKGVGYQLVVVQPGPDDTQSYYTALQKKATVVTRSWLLDSIATYTLQNPHHYTP